MKIVLLAGGLSAEREVSLKSGKGILNALRELGHTVILIDPIYGAEQMSEEVIFKDEISKVYPGFNKINELQKKSSVKLIECINSKIFDDVDFVFLALHGKFGEDGRIQTLLDLKHLKYSGTGMQASCFAMDKDISKSVFYKNDIPTPSWFTFFHDEDIDYDFCKNKLGDKLVIKPNDEGSTVGLTITDNKKDFDAGTNLAKKFSDKILVEEYISGRELTVAVIDNMAYPVIEVKPLDGFYDYEHKYSKGKTEYYCPASIDDSIAERAKFLAINAHKSLGCEVYSRVDFLMTQDGDLECLEVNTLPGFTELSLVPKAAFTAGLGYNELVQKIIDLSFKKYV